ncbi:hypothetical protein M885DRAFT_550969 [Pelagophyceae sp. CCMP2097]|nr:hypothetical protein M885DRAFT_550969 [Pelagophyceae sp. CCMP2097]
MARPNRKDRNLKKAGAALVAVVCGFGYSVYALLGCVGLGRSRFLALLGACAFGYALARLRQSGLCGKKPSREDEAAYLQDKCAGCALVTGCTAGLGRAWVEGLLDRGVAVVMVSRSPEKLAAVEQEFLAKFPDARLLCVAFDFLHGDGRTFYAETLPALLRGADFKTDSRRVGLVINNVGVGSEDPLTIDEVSAEEHDDTISINCGATTKMCRAALPVLAALGGGVVVNVSSGSALQPTPYLCVYAATKAFILHLSKSLDREWRAKGVRVLATAPYYVSDTGLYKGKPAFNAPPPKVVVDGTLNFLANRRHVAHECTHTCFAHACIAFLLTNLAEDAAISPLIKPFAKVCGFNGSMLAIMTKARQRFLEKRKGQ